MKAFFTLSLVCLMVAAAGRTAAAQAPAPRAGVAVTLAPPLGVGAEIAVRAGEQLNLRAGFSMFGLSRQFDNDGIALDAQLTLRSVSAHVDWFPFGGGFHLSPGVMLYNGNELTARASGTRR